MPLVGPRHHEFREYAGQIFQCDTVDCEYSGCYNQVLLHEQTCSLLPDAATPKQCCQTSSESTHSAAREEIADSIWGDEAFLHFAPQLALTLDTCQQLQLEAAALFDHEDEAEELKDTHTSTWWISAPDVDSAGHGSGLEALAAATFRFHTAALTDWDPQSSGVEWWVQVRNSEVGGYDHEEVEWHWDDDQLRSTRTGERIHPTISTVSYLTNAPMAPTLVVEKRISAGDILQPSQQQRVWASWPRAGKHIAFDGRLLHCASPLLSGNNNTSVRISFVANVWLNHVPEGARGLIDEHRHEIPEALLHGVRCCFDGLVPIQIESVSTRESSGMLDFWYDDADGDQHVCRIECPNQATVMKTANAESDASSLSWSFVVIDALLLVNE